MRETLRRKGTLLGAAALLTAALGAAAAAAAPPESAEALPPLASSTAAAASESTAASESAAASAAPGASGAAAAPPELPALRGADIPAEPSKRPGESEWRAARKVRPHRGATDRCELLVVREWLRVLCKDGLGVGLVAGSPKDVKLWTGGHLFGADGQGTRTVVELPLARGSSRIVSFLGIQSDYDAVAFGEAGTMSVAWREGDPDPVIGIYQLDKMDR